jgi:hypothetical protein
MSILIYLKDINPMAKAKNRKVLKRHEQLLIDDNIYKEINHKICLYVCGQSFWMRTDLGYSLIRRIKRNNDVIEEYEITNVSDGKSTKLYYNIIDNIWLINEEQLFPHPIWQKK